MCVPPLCAPLCCEPVPLSGVSSSIVFWGRCVNMGWLCHPQMPFCQTQCSPLEHPGELNLGGVMGQGGSAVGCEAGAFTEIGGHPPSFTP